MSIPSNRRISSNRMAFLDYLRIYAFISVLIWHKFRTYFSVFVSDESIHATPRLILNALFPFYQFGSAGVVVFFLVSGYIITYVLQTEPPIEFIVRRIFRIYPLYLVAVALQTLMLTLIGNPIPSASVLIPRLLLIGDFFNTPYALLGAEWTLRIEMMFYVFMLVLKSFGLLQQHRKWLPWILVAATLMLGALNPIPAGKPITVLAEGLVTGTFTIYSPFLFLGIAVFLREARQISLGALIGLVALVLFHYYRTIAMYQPLVIGSHGATVAVLLFMSAWAFRSHLHATPAILFLSDLAYSVYIFHHWMWTPIRFVLAKLSLNLINLDIQALIVVVGLCIFMSKVVEKPGIRMGKRLVTRWRKPQLEA